MKQQFDLSVWLQDKSRKVVTRDGRPVRIVCWDAKMECPIMALVLNKSNNKEIALHYRVDGTYSALMESDVDLFFENDELTEFEKTMIQFSHERNSLIQFEHTAEEINAHLYLYYKKLLDLARKELLKDLPKWKKVPKTWNVEDNQKVVFSEDYKYYIEKKELFHKLPKE